MDPRAPPQGVIWFRLDKGPLHLVAGQYFKCAPRRAADPCLEATPPVSGLLSRPPARPRRLQQLEGGAH